MSASAAHLAPPPLLPPASALPGAGAVTTGRLDRVTPVMLADLMLACPLRRRANLVVLQPDPASGDYALIVKRGSLTVGTYRFSAEVGNATVARLALIANLDPLADVSGRDAGGQAARVQVRASADTGELLVCVGTGPDGLDAEVRPLLVNGRSLEHAQRGQLKRCVQCATFQPPQRVTCEFDGGILIDIADDPRPGGTVGAYKVGSRLGDGGMGTVLAGEHALIGRAVAIKLLHRSLSDNPVMARRFLAEARAAARIHHPNIVDVTDFGLLSDGRPYMVMERLTGESLEARIDREAARQSALEPAVALAVAREMCTALSAAHQGGVVHRDLKPSNVILLEGSTDESPRLKLVDFGAACLANAATDEGDAIIGTPAYMSPEHARGEPTDGRTDLYALGVVLFEMLTGTVPFDGDDAQEILLKHLGNPPPVPRAPTGPLPTSVTRVVARALRKNADERYQNADEMLADIDRASAALTRRDWRRWLPT